RSVGPCCMVPALCCQLTPLEVLKMRDVNITLISKPGCHLCDEVKPVLDDAMTQLRGEGIRLSFTELNMLDDENLIAQYQEDIPVVPLDGKRRSYWRVDHARFIAAVRKRARGGIRGLLRKPSEPSKETPCP